ncbi:hypothetical protein [Rubellimicrobium roseum]|uniref:DUF2244 domain-containing protein n=1 Tax=Rubellimicrobium roseum TaxID=687525 RepID=A0A5C4NF82_9RHOB|nr:hypothetical protein [Rubellimicrobium roseum]TNC73421.1 hypothetical protein FHG71_06150 [Rubellimicrobium roseum]
MSSDMCDLNEFEPPFVVRQTPWGTLVRRSDGPPILLQVTRGLVGTLAVAFVAAALTLVSLPTPGEAFTLAHVASAIVLVLAAAVLLHVALRGTVIEFHVNLARGELRQIAHHRVGPAAQGRCASQPAVSLHIERRGQVRALMLHQRGCEDGLCIARGPEPALQALRGCIEHDLRLAGPGGRPRL